jgi:hypothetical protein
MAEIEEHTPPLTEHDLRGVAVGYRIKDDLMLLRHVISLNLRINAFDAVCFIILLDLFAQVK